MSSSLSALLSILSGQFYDTMETTNPPTMQVESVRRREPGADALYGPGRYENFIVRVES